MFLMGEIYVTVTLLLSYTFVRVTLFKLLKESKVLVLSSGFFVGHLCPCLSL